MHGRFDGVVYGDVEGYLDIQRFSRPGAEPLERQTAVAARKQTRPPRTGTGWWCVPAAGAAVESDGLAS